MPPAHNQHLGWYQARKLPHYDAPHVLQFITFRLGDALPVSKLREIEAELRMLPAGEQDTQRRHKVEYWLDQGLGCCALSRPELAQVFQQGLMLHHGSRYQLIAWCIMPNHVHILIECRYSLARIVQSWKSYSARWAVVQQKRPTISSAFSFPSHHNNIDRISPSSSPRRLVNWAAAAPLMARWS